MILIWALVWMLLGERQIKDLIFFTATFTCHYQLFHLPLHMIYSLCHNFSHVSWMLFSFPDPSTTSYFIFSFRLILFICREILTFTQLISFPKELSFSLYNFLKTVFSYTLFIFNMTLPFLHNVYSPWILNVDALVGWWYVRENPMTFQMKIWITRIIL
jgi:hypothetical protein